MFNISFCSALSSQIKSILVDSVLLGSTNIELNELPMLCDLPCEDRRGNIPPQNVLQHFPLAAHSPTCTRTVAVPQDAALASFSVCWHGWATVPAHLDTAALGGQFSRAVPPTINLPPRKTQWGIFPLPLSSPAGPVQSSRLNTVRATLVLGWQCRRSSSAASNGKPAYPLSEADT